MFTNQFENTANYNAHFTVTGPEIYQQCLSNVREGAESNVGEETKAEKDSVTHMYNPVISAFVMGAGTGGGYVCTAMDGTLSVVLCTCTRVLLSCTLHSCVVECMLKWSSITPIHQSIILHSACCNPYIGTIGGVSRYLKSVDPNIKIVLADPPGSSLFQKVKYGVCYTSQQCETKVSL